MCRGRIITVCRPVLLLFTCVFCLGVSYTEPRLKLSQLTSQLTGNVLARFSQSYNKRSSSNVYRTFLQSWSLVTFSKRQHKCIIHTSFMERFLPETVS